MVNNGRPAAVTAGQVEMQGGVPVRAGGQVVGAVGVSGFDKEKDVQIADSAAAAVR
jgi:glc operon protein GlcG